MNEVIIDDMTVRIDTDRKSTQEIVQEFVTTENEVSHIPNYCFTICLQSYMKTSI